MHLYNCIYLFDKLNDCFGGHAGLISVSPNLRSVDVLLDQSLTPRSLEDSGIVLCASVTVVNAPVGCFTTAVAGR